MYQCLLPLEKVCESTPDIDRSILNLRTLQLSDEKHGNQACHIGTHWLLSSHNILISNDRSERYDDRKSAGPICLYPGVCVSRNVIVRLHFPPACFSDDADPSQHRHPSLKARGYKPHPRELFPTQPAAEELIQSQNQERPLRYLNVPSLAHRNSSRCSRPEV